ncbi:MAG TPA: hypothetical protein VGH14_12795 [Solirubrobacterales bacterium]
MLHDLPGIAIALIVLGAVIVVWRTRDDDPIWQERWSALSPADRTRIAAAARDGSLLASDEEIELAAGYARRDQRRQLPYTLMLAIRLPLGIALIAGGLLADSSVLVVFGAFFSLAGLWSLSGDLRIRRGLRETMSRDRH